MIPRRLFTGPRSGESSPSVTLEKGAYRMRAPSNRPVAGPLDFSGKNAPTARPSSRHPSAISCGWIILISLLLLGCLVSFGMAYYLFSTRWDLRDHALRQPTDAIQVIEPPYLSVETPSPHEKYLSYLPHSGYHNQRIAFENALTLAHLLNRTLIVPPIRLGSQPIRYYNFDTLSRYLALSGKEGLKHCALVPDLTFASPECGNYFNYTFLSWDWLVNLTDIATYQKLLHRWDLRPQWIQSYLQLSPSDVYHLKDMKPYQYRFLDNASDPAPPNEKFDGIIHIDDLAQKTQRLIQVGTLFGTSRLRLVHEDNDLFRAKIRQSMVFAPTQLNNAVQAVLDELPSIFLGAHVRLGDGWFRNSGEENVRLVWWRLVHQVLRYSVTETMTLERLMDPHEDEEVDLRETPHLAPDEHISLQLPSDYNPLVSSRLPCHRSRHTAAHLLLLNTPLYVSTDAKDPFNDPLLSLFLKTFPCIFFLGDFPHQTGMLDSLHNGYDGVPLKPFLLPFMDSMVAAKAWRVVGTEGSTFSRFVEDVLWTTYHGESVVQRG
ncbi:hypothetical protein BDZ89DRAFT_1020143 [Hymenopellis radicata]|nr:hypothetical protein BDZ89DRAFT_1020143 [Hymenopellis radicata]